MCPAREEYRVYYWNSTDADYMYKHGTVHEPLTSPIPTLNTYIVW